jgi:serine protease Do
VPDPRQRALFPFFPNLPRYAEGTVPMLGSGIVLDSRGYFLTNHHLVGEADSIWVLLSDGRHFPAEVRGTDKNYDLAVIRVMKQGEETFETAPLGNSDEMMVGEWVVALGNPYGQYIEDANPSVTAGVVSALHRDIKITEGSAIYKDMIQTDAAINPGNSGGPLVNADGEVIGINTFIFSESGGSLGIGFAIPINTAIEVAGELILYGHVRGVWIGIGVQELTEFYARQLGVAPGNGLLVWSLEKGSPSEQAGIRLGDVIRGINGKQVRDADQAKHSMFGARSGDTITFQIEREGQMLDVPVTLESLPGNG